MDTYNGCISLILLIIGVPYISCIKFGSFNIDITDIAPFQLGLKMTQIERIKNVKFFLFTRENTLDKIEMKLGKKSTYKSFDPNRVTHLIIHGWICPFTFMYPVKDSILESNDYNVIIVSWPSIHFNYVTSKTDTVVVGERIAKFLDDLVEKKQLNLSNVHVLGHSLGAQTAGVVGNRVTKGKLGRVTGLDPSGPLFAGNLTSPENKLSPDDAECVQAVHTNDGVLALDERLGHADFLVNGGKKQPGCDGMMDATGGCSHIRAVELYMQWVKKGVKYTATECETWKNYEQGKCSKNKNALMVADINEPCGHGKFFLKTSGVEPFEQLKV